MEKQFNESYCETLQEITALAYNELYCHDSRYEDSQTVFAILREWAQEFEDWWNSLDGDEREIHDYVIDIENFTEEKLKTAKDSVYEVSFTLEVRKGFLIKASNHGEAITLAKKQLALDWAECGYRIIKTDVKDTN